MDKDEKNFKVVLSINEKIICLEEIVSKLKKVLYVYDKSQEPDSTYNYRVYCGGIMMYVSSSNILFDGELVSIIININAILTNQLEIENNINYSFSAPTSTGKSFLFRELLKKYKNEG